MAYERKETSPSSPIKNQTQPQSGSHRGRAFDQHPSSPQQLMQLQRMIGNQALLQLQKQTPVNSSEALPSGAPGSVIQRVIVTGKTHRSKPIGNLKRKDWYKGLDPDAQRWAVLLHSKVDETYTMTEAAEAIKKHIDDKDELPSEEDNPKKRRLAEVTAHINKTAPEITDEDYGVANILALAGERAYKRMKLKHRKTDRHKESVKTIEENEPGLMDVQTSILDDRTPWEQVTALTATQPDSYNFVIGGTETKLDAISIKDNARRRARRPRGKVNKAQTFFEQSGHDNSYWKLSDNPTHIDFDQPLEQLRHLEVEREYKAAFTTYLKDILHKLKYIDNKEAFGDLSPLASMEFKGATSPTKNMARIQIASAKKVLEKALEHPDEELGEKIGERPVTTAKQINEKLSDYLLVKTDDNFLKLVKEIVRLIRTEMKADYDSEREGHSDEDI